MIGCIIQARMGSSRLPGKVMMCADKNNPILFSVIKQIEKSKFLEKIVVATTDLEDDDVLENFVKKIGLSYFRGSSDDVLDRYYNCAKKFSFSSIVRITGDCPLNDYQVVDEVIEKFLSGKYDYVTNARPTTFPYGMSVEVFSFNALKDAWKNSKKPSEREHVTPYMYNHPEKFCLSNVKCHKNFSKIRLMVDRKNDFELVKEVFLKIKNRPILLNDIKKLFNQEPELLNMNKDYLPNEGYLKSLKKDKKFINSSKNKISENEKN